MFWKLHRAKRVDLACPHCGHSQREPSLVVSSFCRACGEYFRVRKGVSLANPGLRVSGIAEMRPDRPKTSIHYVGEDSGEEVKLAAETGSTAAEEKDSEARPRTPSEPDELDESSEPDEPDEGIGLSAGEFFGLVNEKTDSGQAGDPTDNAEAGDTAGIGVKAQGRETLAQGSMAALIHPQSPTVVAGNDKMPPNYVAPMVRRKRDESVTEVSVRCFRCYHVQSVSSFAKSTQCDRCSAYISLANYEIKTVKSHTIHTRGDVSISRKGGLINDSEIACNNLTVSGAIDAHVDCSGDVVIRHSGTIRGKLFCQRLAVEKNCEVRFPDGVMADRADINGHFMGDLTCSGIVKIGRYGIIQGDLTTVEVETKDGGRVVGLLKIDSETTTELPLRKGFNPAIIG